MENTDIKVLKEMYTSLFNEVTDALKELEKLKEKLENAQKESELIFINN